MGIISEALRNAETNCGIKA